VAASLPTPLDLKIKMQFFRDPKKLVKPKKKVSLNAVIKLIQTSQLRSSKHYEKSLESDDITLSKKKGGFERLNLTANLQGISNLIKSPTTATGGLIQAEGIKLD